MLDQLKEYLATRLLLLKMDVTEKLSEAFALLFQRIVLALFSVVFTFFFSVAIALYIGQYYESMALGFLWVAAFHLVVLLILFIFRRRLLQQPIEDEIIQIAFQKDNASTK